MLTTNIVRSLQKLKDHANQRGFFLRNLSQNASSINQRAQMKIRSFLFVFIPSMMLFMATTCEDDFVMVTCEEQLASLNELELEIETLIMESVCGDSFECRSIAFGTKPCGGPWRYLTYSTSIDTLRLQSLVQDYNFMEEDYNFNCDVVSDCAVAIPPSGFDCQDNRCVPLD